MSLEKPRPLDQIIRDMAIFADPLTAGDTEANHYDADELLLEAILLLANNSDLQRHHARRLVELYQKIDKWYA